MKKIISKLMPLVSNVAFATAFAVIGTTCRSWLYQPAISKNLLDKE